MIPKCLMLWPLFVYYNQVHHTLPNIPSWPWCMACLVVRHCCHWQLSSKVALRPSLDCTYQLVSSGECHNNLTRKVLSFWFCLQPLGGGDQCVAAGVAGAEAAVPEAPGLSRSDHSASTPPSYQPLQLLLLSSVIYYTVVCSTAI